MTYSPLATFRSLAAAAVLGLAGAAASAATVSFAGVTDSGPLIGAAFSGSFSYADPADAAFRGSIDLDSFSLSFDGLALTLADADLAPVAWFDAGSFLGVDFDATTTSPWQISLRAGFFGVDEAFFSYTDAGTGAQGFGSPVFTVQPPVGVPEPASLALAAGALGLMAVARRRAARG